jgi:peroxin-5
MTPFLQAFFDSSKAQAPFHPGATPAMDLSVTDQCRIRDRSTILARHVFADRGNVFADEQVSKLLSSLHIDPAALPTQANAAAWDRIYAGGAAAKHAAGAAMAAPRPAWVEECENMRLAQHGKAQLAPPAHPSAWADEYHEAAQQQPGQGWADEFRAAADAGIAVRQAARGGDAVEQTKQLAATLSASTDPKIKNSKFLQFVSKMSRGELIMEDNQVKEVAPQTAAWVNEYSSAQQRPPPTMWGDEFASFQAEQHPHAGATAQGWAEDFAGRAAEGDWASEFANGATAGGQWAAEFAATDGTVAPGIANWEEEYLAELEHLHSAAGPRSAGEYVMSEDNPFLLDVDSYSTGKELFRRGLLSEAVLALEAECQRSPHNSEAWRLLGTVQAENDDDQQAIAAMNRALAADPDNLEVLLSLGVSHTNELDQKQAVGYLRQWLVQHYTYGAEARQAGPPPDSSQALSHTVRMFAATARTHSTDADVHVALGVLCNLSRHYDEAVSAFRAALQLRPQDYSLWNKLGATLANSGRSGEAVAAYQKALDLKPNYMRAWTNMGISLANLGDYEGSARYYVRALSLNPRAEGVWGYLTTTLACLGAMGQFGGAVEGKELAALAAAFPL